MWEAPPGGKAAGHPDDTSLREEFWASLHGLADARLREIISLRWGLEGCVPQTLESIGQMHGVTRERVRQLEYLALRQLADNAPWVGRCREKCAAILERWGPAVPTAELAKFDPWFSGFSLPAQSWRSLLKLVGGGLTVLQANRLLALTRVEWLPDVTAQMNELREARKSGLSDEAVFARWRDSTPSGRASTESFARALAKLVPKQRVQLERVVKNFLDETDQPVGAKDLLALAEQRGWDAHQWKKNVLANALGRYAVPISRRPTLFVTRRTLSASDHLISRFCDQFHAHWLRHFKESRVFHGDEVRDWALSQGFANELAVFDQPNWACVAILCFDFSQRYRSNKLKVWLPSAWGGQTPPGAAQRIENLLQRAGRPMTTEELIAGIRSDVGVGPTFQIQESETIERVAEKTWRHIDPRQTETLTRRE